MQMLGKFGAKTKLTFSAPSPMFKKRFCDTALCWLRIEPTYFEQGWARPLSYKSKTA